MDDLVERARKLADGCLEPHSSTFTELADALSAKDAEISRLETINSALWKCIEKADKVMDTATRAISTQEKLIAQLKSSLAKGNTND
jgi:hypothetical protein